MASASDALPETPHARGFRPDLVGAVAASGGSTATVDGARRTVSANSCSDTPSRPGGVSDSLADTPGLAGDPNGPAPHGHERTLVNDVKDGPVGLDSPGVPARMASATPNGLALRPTPSLLAAEMRTPRCR
jgi:hypothetical protein